MGAVLALFGSKNFLPVIIGGAIGLALIVGAIVLFEKGKSAAKAQAAQAVIKAQERADKLSEKLVTEQRAHEKQLEEATNSIRERVVHVAVTTACRDVPAIKHAIDGVQQLLGPRGSAP